MHETDLLMIKLTFYLFMLSTQSPYWQPLFAMYIINIENQLSKIKPLNTAHPAAHYSSPNGNTTHTLSTQHRTKEDVVCWIISFLTKAKCSLIMNNELKHHKTRAQVFIQCTFSPLGGTSMPKQADRRTVLTQALKISTGWHMLHPTQTHFHFMRVDGVVNRNSYRYVKLSVPG